MKTVSIRWKCVIKLKSVYCLSVPFRLIRSICFLSVKCESMYFMRKIKFMPCYWEFLFYQTCLGRSVCNRKIKLRNFLKVGAKKKRKFKKIHSELTKQRTHKTSPKYLVHFLAKTKILSWKHISILLLPCPTHFMIGGRGLNC